MSAITDAIKRFHEAHGFQAGEGEIKVKQTTIKTPAIDKEQRLVKGLVSVAVPDMDDEVVLAARLDTSYFPERVKAVYYNHNYNDLPVGTCRRLGVRTDEKALFATTYILPGARGDDLLTCLESGAINGFSIGFRADEFGPPTPEETKEYGSHTTIVRRGLLIEYSITPMPACPDALVDLVSKAKIHRSNAVFFGLPDTPARKFFPTTERKVLKVRPVFRPS